MRTSLIDPSYDERIWLYVNVIKYKKRTSMWVQLDELLSIIIERTHLFTT